VVHDLRAVAFAQEALGHRHPDAVRESLAERSSGGLDAGGLVAAEDALGVSGRERSPLPEAFDLVQRHVVAAHVQDAVQQHRPMSGGQHEAVAVGPGGVARVVPEVARVEQIATGAIAIGIPR
jgi:hypothetical protein